MRVVLLCLLLAGCAPGKVVTKTEVIEVPVITYHQYPSEVTEPLLIPEWPTRALTVDDLLDRIEVLKGMVKRANADRKVVRGD